MEIIDGKKIAAEIYSSIEAELKLLTIKPELHIIAATDDESALKYAQIKTLHAQDLGIDAIIHRFDNNTTSAKIISHIEALSSAKAPVGIMVQLPLYESLYLEKNQILNSIPSHLDVDGLNATNLGLLSQSIDAKVLPATVAAVWECVLAVTNSKGEGRHAVIVNHSTLIGRPLADLLLHHGFTVTVAHEHTANLAAITQQADLLVTATGQVGLITAEHVRQGAIVIDVTSKRIDQTGPDGQTKVVTRGDVNRTPELEAKLTALTPVPGGVGPVTVACLLRNLLTLSRGNRV